MFGLRIGGDVRYPSSYEGELTIWLAGRRAWLPARFACSHGGGYDGSALFRM